MCVCAPVRLACWAAVLSVNSCGSSFTPGTACGQRCTVVDYHLAVLSLYHTNPHHQEYVRADHAAGRYAEGGRGCCCIRQVNQNLNGIWEVLGGRATANCVSLACTHHKQANTGTHRSRAWCSSDTVEEARCPAAPVNFVAVKAVSPTRIQSNRPS